MNDRQPYSTPEVVPLGRALDLTEGGGSPVAEGFGGSGVYWNANPPDGESETGAEGTPAETESES
jgi:hypothetical protein